jgi:hypothetical protein
MRNNDQILSGRQDLRDPVSQEPDDDKGSYRGTAADVPLPTSPLALFLQIGPGHHFLAWVHLNDPEQKLE